MKSTQLVDNLYRRVISVAVRLGELWLWPLYFGNADKTNTFET